MRKLAITSPSAAYSCRRMVSMPEAPDMRPSASCVNRRSRPREAGAPGLRRAKLFAERCPNEAQQELRFLTRQPIALSKQPSLNRPPGHIGDDPCGLFGGYAANFAPLGCIFDGRGQPEHRLAPTTRGLGGRARPGAPP